MGKYGRVEKGTFQNNTIIAAFIGIARVTAETRGQIIPALNSITQQRNTQQHGATDDIHVLVAGAVPAKRECLPDPVKRAPVTAIMKHASSVVWAQSHLSQYTKHAVTCVTFAHTRSVRWAVCTRR